jgi:hypothetical protein
MGRHPSTNVPKDLPRCVPSRVQSSEAGVLAVTITHMGTFSMYSLLLWRRIGDEAPLSTTNLGGYYVIVQHQAFNVDANLYVL